jgi:hypothetical protein
MATAKKATAQEELNKLIPLRKATFTEEEKRKLVEGTNAQGKPLTEKEDMELSKMHTARTLGADWRERAAETLRREEPARAQQALDERAAINRRMQGSPLPSPLQKDVSKTVVNLPGGGKVKFGINTLANMRDFEKQKSEAKAAENIRKQNILYDAGRRANTALQKRYEDELASRGFTPPKTRQEQEAIDRAKMDEFRVALEARNLAREKLNTSQKDYKFYNSLAAQAMASGNAKQAEDLMRAAQATGGSIKNYSARRKFLEDQEMNKARALISEKTKARIAKTQVQNTSNPEAASFTPSSGTKREMSVSGTAPLGVGSAMPSYQLPYQKPSGPTEQPFGMTTPTMVDSGVDFSSISPYNAAETRITETTPKAVSPTTRGVMPATKTSKQQTIEDVLPGVSNMPVVQRNQKETPAQHNARVMQEYEKNVVVPSFDDSTQNALQSAIDLNKQKDELFGVRLTSQENIKKYKDISNRLSKEQDVLKKTRDKLRSEKRNLSKYPMNSKERQFLDLQIATLQNQLSFLGKMF